jgi:hypothetical protein
LTEGFREQGIDVARAATYAIKVAGKSGIEEINVDAITGAVLAHEHESPEAEKAEAAKEKKAK